MENAFWGSLYLMMDAARCHRLRTWIRASIFSLAALFSLSQTVLAQGETAPAEARNNSVPTAAAGTISPIIVVGFVGGFIRHDDPVHSEVQLAARLRKAYPSGVVVETFESYHGEN